MTRTCATLVLGALALIATPTQAQTTGTIPVWVDPPTQTLGDSPLVQCGNGTSVCIGPGNSPAFGPGSTLMGFTNSTQFNAIAVYGEATAPTGTTNGVVGVTKSANTGATGVFGWAASPGGSGGILTGVWGRATAFFGRGVVGEGGYRGVYGTSFQIGVFGESDLGTGVYGTSNNWGGYFDGYLGFTHLMDGGTQPLCRNDSNGGIGQCSSSLRYKTDVLPFSGGLDIVSRLRPIAFTWKQGGIHDVGLAAEEVEQVEPLLTFRNDKGEIEGVKYNQLSAVFVNAFVEQQAQIKKQRDQIDALTALVCESHPDAAVCQ